jgi:predicted amidohydrolase
MSDLKITLIQSDLFWENKEKNLEFFSNKIDAIKQTTDLIILPEMFSTGFSMNTEQLAESLFGNTFNWMKQKAIEKNSSITGSFICEENGNYYNRLLWMNADGTYSTYDKRHLFRMGDENNNYNSGNKKLIVELKGWKICPLVCYDLRFPVWSRNENGENNYDLLLYIANWPERRAYAWKTLLPARAIENQCYVAGLNRVGNDGNSISHSGDSVVLNFKGETISNIAVHQEVTETIILNKETLYNFRKEFPVLLDADSFEIKN